MRISALVTLTASAVALAACGQVLDLGDHAFDAGGPPDGASGIDAAGGPTGDVVAYRTAADLDALFIGRWLRLGGPAQLRYETLGIELTAAHELYAIQRAPDGSLERVEPDAQGVKQWSASFDDAGAATVTFAGTGAGSYQISGPVFVDHGSTMWLLYQPQWSVYSRFTGDAGQ